MSPDHTGKDTANTEPEILLAIATALHMETTFPEGRQRITMQQDGSGESPWGFTGKLQRLTSRKNIHIRSRK